ncbi:MAG: tol-pal system YbgF family protein [Polyangiales bacterium]
MSDPLDDLLDTACEGLREDTAAGSESGKATGRAVIAGLARRRRRKDWAMASVVAFCVLFVAPTVWAHVTGRLNAIVAVLVNPPPAQSARAENETQARRLRPAPQPEIAQADPAEDITETAPLLAEELPEELTEELTEELPPEPREAEEDSIAEREISEPQISETQRSPRPPRRHREAPDEETQDVIDESAEEEDTIDVEERELFSRAHRTHFDGGTSSQALRHWDDYLAAYPHGRFVPEARFNRALTLIRLGQLTQARGVLERFARGDFGAARRTQAAELLELIVDESLER